MVSEDCTHVKSRLNYIDCHRHIIWILPCSSIVDRGHFRHAVHIDFMIENITQHCTCCNACCALDNITCILATAWKYMWSARFFSTCYKYKYVLQTCNMYMPRAHAMIHTDFHSNSFRNKNFNPQTRVGVKWYPTNIHVWADSLDWSEF